MSVDVQISGDRTARLRLGISLAQTGKLEDAAAEFNALLTGNSRDTDALNNLAIVYRRQGKSQDALGALLDAIDIDPTRAEFQYNLGKVYKQLGNFKSAAMACAKAVESEPALVPAYINLGAAYYQLHEFGKAANFLKKGLDIDPANEILRTSYEAAVAAKKAVESSGESPVDTLSGGGLPGDDSSAAEIPEAGDIFLGAGTAAGEAETVPVSAGIAVSGPAADDAPETASPYTLADILGLLQYLLELAAFFPVSAQRVFREQGIEQGIKNLVDALSCSGENASQATPEPAVDNQISIVSLTRMLNHLSELTRNLPQTEQRDTLKQKMENIIEKLNATALE
jgi:tetratricopeptide (TPR) repeat protein